MMSSLWLVSILIAQAGVGESAAQITSDGAAASGAIAEAMDGLWDDVLGGGLYIAIAQLGVFFAVGTLLLFIVQWSRALMENESPQAFSEMIWPVIVIILLANNAEPLAEATKGLRGIINQVNQQLLESTSASIRLQEAYQQVMTEVGATDTIRSIQSQCGSFVNPQQQTDCLNQASQQAEAVAGSLPQEPSNGFQQALDQLNVGKQVSNFLQTNIFQMAVRGWLISFSIAFQWIVEISLLLTALLGPLAVGGSLLPVGQKAIYAWLTGFFSVAMVKICFNIIAGLVATLVVNAGTNDPMVFAFAVGLLAPVLALVLASGGGMAVFNSLSSLARFGLGQIIK